MSYQAVPSAEQSEGKEEAIKHRNPVYPALRYPTPKGSTTLGTTPPTQSRRSPHPYSSSS